MSKIIKLCLIMMFSLQLFANEERIIIGYLPTWKDWEVNDIAGDKLTIIKLSFLHIKDNKVTFGNNSPSYTFENSVLRMQELKNKYPHLKVMISVGGWGIDGFSDIAADPKLREQFTISVADFIRKYNFDGVDIDWEFPIHGAWGVIKARAEDKQNFVLLIEEMRNQLNKLDQETNKYHYLSLAVGVGPWVVKGVDFKAMELNVDFFGVMAYNLAGSWSDKTENHVALYKDKMQWATDDAVKLILQTGIKPKQIVLGTAFYGRVHANVEGDTEDGLYQKFQGHGGKEHLTYKDIAENYLNNPDYNLFFHKETQSTHLYSKKDKVFISYADPKSIKVLIDYTKKHSLGGILIWEITQDDGQKTLLNTIGDNY